mgnify:CR=1 FL=1
MIDFREVRLEDKPLVDSLICASGCHGADYSFANLFIWRHAYKPQIAYINNRIIIHMPEAGGLYAFLKETIELMRTDAHERGNRFEMRGLTPMILDQLKDLYGDSFSIREDRDNADYIYTVEKLCELRGRHLSSKRNHIKHFERNGSWHFERVTAENIAPAKEFVKTFYEAKDDPDLTEEAIAINEMFDNFDVLGFYASLLYQNNVPVAFSAGTKLDNITFDTHFEKALPDVEAAYTMINREFAKMVHGLLPDIQYFNREEDMGMEGLRRAKESYHPDILLMKYTVTEV